MFVGLACHFSVNTTSAEATTSVCMDALAFQPPVYSDGTYIEITTSGSSIVELFSPNQPDVITAGVDVAINEISNPVVAEQARSVLRQIREALWAFDVSTIPALRGSCHDDGSFTVEWRFPDRRLAFTLESDPAESGWHFISSSSSDDVRAYGGLPKGDLRLLLGWALRQTPNS